MLDAKMGKNALECAILPRNFQKFFGGIAPGPPCWEGATVPLLTPSPYTPLRSGASRLVRGLRPAFGPSVVRLYVPEWRNQKLATLVHLKAGQIEASLAYHTVNKKLIRR